MKKLKLFTFVAILMAAFSASGQVPYFEWARKIPKQSVINPAVVDISVSDMTIDAQGNIYVVGALSDSVNVGFGGSDEWDIMGAGVYLAKFDAQGTKLWSKEYYSGLHITQGAKIRVDNNGFIFISAYIMQQIQMDSLFVGNSSLLSLSLVKFTNNGVAISTTSMSGWSLLENDFAIDNNGNVILSGYFDGYMNYGDTSYIATNSSEQLFIAKYNNDLNLIWLNTLGEQTDNVSNIPSNVMITTDEENNIYAAGTFYDTIFKLPNTTPLFANQGIFTAKYSPSGELLLHRKSDVGGIGYYISNIALAGKTGLYVTGKIPQSTTGLNGLSFSGGYFLAKLDKTTGDGIWIRGIGNESLSIDTNGNAYTIGNYYGAIQFQNNSIYAPAKLITKYDSLGNGIWGKPVPSNVGLFVRYNNATNKLQSCAYFPTSFADGTVSIDHAGLYLCSIGIGNVISGKIRAISGSNCADTLGGLPEYIVKSNKGEYTLSNMTGTYQLAVPKDTITRIVSSLPSVEVADLATQVCPSTGNYVVNFPVATQPVSIVSKDFGYNVINCHRLSVDVSVGRLRPCSKTTTTIRYKNAGAGIAPNAYVLVKFPSYLVPKQSALTWSLVDAATHTYRFELGNVAAGVNTYFTVQDSVLCNAPMNHTLCAQASIFPVSDCPLPSNWSGSAVTVKGSCVGNGMVRLGIYNPTANNMSDSVNYKVYYDSLLIAQKKVKLAASDSLSFQVLANGHTIRLEAEQVANHPTEQQVSVVLEGCVQAGGIVTTGFVDAFSANNTVNTATSCNQVRNSYDPNDKQVFPRGLTSANIVAPNTELEYLIRFQNTGNDTAYIVTVVDTLSEKLDIESLRLGAMSHKGTMDLQTLNGKTYLRWTFANIMLPDSGANQLGSNGFVQFYIKPLSSNALGTKVRNKAGIYFDYNVPVITNETVTTFDNIVYSNPSLGGNVITASKSNVVKGSWLLWPNPSKGEFHVSLSERSEVTVTDVTGKIYYSQKQESGANTIRLLDYASGLYFVKVSDSQGVSMKKIVLE